MAQIEFVHVTHELAPHRIEGGLAFAVARLVEQLAEAGARSQVYLGSIDPDVERCVTSWGELLPFVVRGTYREQVASLTELLAPMIAAMPGDRIVVGHDGDCAALLVHARRRGTAARLVYWLHSLYHLDPAFGVPEAMRHELRRESISASASAAADIVCTSAGILADAEEIEWPPSMRALQVELLRARARGALLTVESTQNLPPLAPIAVELEPTRPYVLFPSRPVPTKGIGIFMAIADRLARLDVDFVVTGEPAGIDMNRPGARRIRWIGWQSAQDLPALLRAASCVVIPSFNEGYGLSAAEAVQRGVPVLHHDIGGLRTLPTSPNSIAIALAPVERTNMYRTWAEMCERGWEPWACYDRAQPHLEALIDRWVERVEDLLRNAVARKEPLSIGSGPTWGRLLFDRMVAR